MVAADFVEKSTKLTRYGDFYICLVYPFVSENGNEGQIQETLGPGTEIRRLDIVQLAPISPSRDSKIANSTMRRLIIVKFVALKQPAYLSAKAT